MHETTESGDGWRALPLTAVAALYVRGVQRFVRENLLAFAGAGTGIAISDALGWREFVGIALLVLLGGLLVALVYRRRFRYSIDDDAVRVRKGLLEQKEVKVRLERIQNVGFSQPIYLKPLSLTRVTLETPGAAQTEVELPGIATDEARALRDLVNGVRGDASEPGSGEDAGERADDRNDDAPFRAGAADLFRYGLTSNQVWILLAFIGGPAANWVGERVEAAVKELTDAGLISAEQLAGAPWMAALLVFGLLIAVALLLMLLSGMLAVVRFHGYALTGDAERFRAGFGLLDAREKTLRKAKLHSVELVQTGIGRLVDNWHVIGHQTGSAQVQQPGGGDRRFLVPGIDAGRVTAVAAALRGEAWRFPALEGVDRRLRTVLWTRLCAPLLAVAALLQWAAPGPFHWPALALAGLSAVLAGLMHLRWRRWGWALEGDRLTVRSGLIGQSWLVFDLDRCQQARVTTSPYQRRHDLATLHLRLPHGEQSIPYLRQETAAALANRALFSAERALSHAL